MGISSGFDPVKSIARSKLLGSEDETGSSGAGRVGSLDSSRTGGRWSRGAVVVIRAREDGARRRCKARVEGAAFNVDSRERVGSDRPFVRISTDW